MKMARIVWTFHGIRSVLLTFSVLLGVACLLLDCSSSVAPKSNSPTPTIVPVPTLPMSARSFAILANERALAWASDAFLIGITVDSRRIEQIDHLPDIDLVEFEYCAPSHGYNSYTFGFKAGGSNFTIAGSQSKSLPIESSDWAIDIDEAWQIAARNGGNEFLQRYKTEDTKVFLQLQRWVPRGTGPAAWYIFYAPTRGNSMFHIDIDARSGQVLDKLEH